MARQEFLAHQGALLPRPLDVLHEIFHHKALYRANVHAGAFVAQRLCHDGSHCRDANALQPLLPDGLQVARAGDLVKPLYLG